MFLYFCLLFLIPAFGANVDESISFTDTTELVNFIFEWFLPEKHQINVNLESVQWEKNGGIAHCEAIVKYGKGKTVDNNAIDELKERIVRKNMIGNSKTYLEKLLNKGEIDDLIKRKWIPKDKSMSGFIREVFVVAKILLETLIGHYVRNENQKGLWEKFYKNGWDLAMEKYQNAQMFFVKCGLKISTEIDKAMTNMSILIYIPNFREVIDKHRISINVSVAWKKKEENVEKLWTRGAFKLNDAIGIIKFVNYFIDDFCNLSGDSDISKAEEKRHSSSIFECFKSSTKNSKKFVEFFTKIAMKLINFSMENAGKELLKYEFGRMKQRILEIEELMEIDEQQKIRTFGAALIHYGVTVLEDLMAKMDDFNYELVVENEIIMDKYFYKGQLKWAKKSYSAMKRRIKYLDTAVRLAPNGSKAFSEYKAPAIRPILDKQTIEILNKIDSSDQVIVIDGLIKMGNKFARKDSVKTIKYLLEILRKVKGELGMDGQFEREFNEDIGRILGKELAEDPEMGIKMELTAIYGNAVQMAKNLDLPPENEYWRINAIREMARIIDVINGVDEVETKIAKILMNGDGECGNGHGKGNAKEVVRVWKNIAMNINYGKIGGENGEGCLMEGEIYAKLEKIFGKIVAKFENGAKGRGNWRSYFYAMAAGILAKIGWLKKMKQSLENVLMGRVEMTKRRIMDEKRILDEEDEPILTPNSALNEVIKIAVEEIAKMREDLKAIKQGNEQLNIVDVGTYDESAIIQLKNFKLAAYDHVGMPSFSESKKTPRICFPGELRFVSGKLVMREELPENVQIILKLTAKFCVLGVCATICDRGKVGKSNASYFSMVANPKETLIKAIIQLFTGGQNICTHRSQNKYYMKDFHLGTVHFVENLFKNVFLELIEDKDFYKYEEDRNMIKILMAGLLEPEAGFFELMSLLPKDISAIGRKAANARWMIGLEISDAESEKKILSLKIPAKENEYVDVKM